MYGQKKTGGAHHHLGFCLHQKKTWPIINQSSHSINAWWWWETKTKLHKIHQGFKQQQQLCTIACFKDTKNQCVLFSSLRYIHRRRGMVFGPFFIFIIRYDSFPRGGCYQEVGTFLFYFMHALCKPSCARSKINYWWWSILKWWWWWYNGHKHTHTLTQHSKQSKFI